MEKLIKQLEALKNEAQYKIEYNTYYQGKYSAYHKAIELIKKEIKKRESGEC